MCLCGWRRVGIGWFSRVCSFFGIVRGFTESFIEVGPDADDGDGEEEEEEGGSVGVEKGACGGFEEDVEWGDHGSDDKEWCGDGAGGEDGDLDVEPKGQGNGPEERIPVLEPVEDGVA